jgi:aspartate/methionine/tyrosine aminotransferase
LELKRLQKISSGLVQKVLRNDRARRGFLVEEDSAGEGLVFARYHADINSTELGMRLIQDYSVEIVPGDHFGMDGHLRFSFGLPEDYLGEGLDRISQMIATLR